MLPCTIVAFGVRNIRTDDAITKPNHHKLIRTNRRQRSHAEEALMPCGRLYSRIICEVAPMNCTACHQRRNASQPQHGRHDHAPSQKGSGTCQANRRCDCFGAAMVIVVSRVVSSPLVIGSPRSCRGPLVGHGGLMTSQFTRERQSTAEGRIALG